ncbi:CAP domain-containing protein [Lyngbya confervoides]|uniref:CAP domain-containing protein n=1 Tax=Lyngbya confervoides BDU141951 TaxID=1574623 RepID=A0ABD4T1C6_9CYAN|nr:CAP domain-containing protein [Lyngbya confervoides]MCM1982245.1 CAP domain-containing protein [Lyngbya confervoides BDU141951]
MGGKIIGGLAIAAMTTGVFAGNGSNAQTLDNTWITRVRMRLANSWTAALPQRRSRSQMQAYSLKLVNRDRKNYRRSRLMADPLLTQVAQRHAEDMATRNFFGHVNPWGQTPSDRIKAAGGSGGVAENLAYQMSGSGIHPSYPLAETFQDGWMRSAGHRANLLNPTYHRFGYGIATSRDGTKVFAVQLFR